MSSSLFEPICLGPLQLKNRIIMAPMTREFSPNGIPGADVVDYYRRRADGEVGLIITEGVGIDHPAAIDNTGVPKMYGEQALAGWQQVVDSVHAAGGKIFPQLWHQGPLRDPTHSAHPDQAGLRPSGLWGRPGVTTYSQEYVERMSTPTQPMTEEDIADVIAAFASAAHNAANVGFDGIAIHGAHGYLIDSFFWPDTNKRTDRYGGTPLKRATFGCEVVRAVRDAIGPDLPIMFRFSQHKQQDYKARFADSPEELAITLNALSEAGVDIFDASTRQFDTPAFAGSSKTLAGWAREITGKPSVAIGGVGLNNTRSHLVTEGEEILATNNVEEVCRLHGAGMFDFVAVGRALLGDPHWAKKIRLGETCRPFSAADLTKLV